MTGTVTVSQRHSVTVHKVRRLPSRVDADGYDSQGSPVSGTSDGETDGVDAGLSDGFFSDQDVDASQTCLSVVDCRKAEVST